jgi:4-amino-4-deoxy-L-arabinose transferase-like glycosyltransferase
VPARSYRWCLGGACAVGLALRLVYVFVVKAGAALQGDAYYFHGQARLNLEGHWFVDPTVYLSRHPDPALLPSAQHPPVFTLLLTVGDAVGLRSVTAQLVLECLIGTATIALTGMVARDLVSPRAGAIAAVIAALYPGFWVFDGEVMSEALVMLLAALVVLVANRCFRAFTVRRLVLLALLTGLCALTRAELVLLVPLVALPTVLWQRSLAWRRRAALCGLALVVAVAPMVPWFARNFVVFHQPVFLSDQLPITLASANNTEAYYGPLTASWCYTCLLNAHLSRRLSEAGAGSYWDTRAKDYIEAHKGRAAVVALERVGLEWDLYAPLRQTDQDFLEGWPTPVSDAWLVWFYPLAALAVAGGVILRRRRQPLYPLAALFVVPTLAAVVTYGNYRFRSEAEVGLVVLAAVALDALWATLAGRPSPTASTTRPSPTASTTWPSPTASTTWPSPTASTTRRDDPAGVDRPAPRLFGPVVA